MPANGDIDAAGGPATSSHMMKTTKRGRPHLKVCVIRVQSWKGSPITDVFLLIGRIHLISSQH